MKLLMGSIALAALLASACGSDDDGADPDAATAGIDARDDVAPMEVTLTTDDNVDLIADLYLTGSTGDPGVILLHMIPPGNTKANYTSAFIQPVVAAGFNVLNVNRRGAAGSGGVASEAYSGPNGKLDAKAAYDFLIAHSSAVPAASIAVVGASNGTTTTTDFSIFADGDATVVQPAALVFLSGGSYTESQNAISANLDALDNHPIYFAYPPNEATWNEGIKATAPQTWSFTEYSPGAHGTGLFASNPEVITDVVAFLEAAL